MAICILCAVFVWKYPDSLLYCFVQFLQQNVSLGVWSLSLQGWHVCLCG